MTTLELKCHCTHALAEHWRRPLEADGYRITSLSPEIEKWVSPDGRDRCTQLDEVEFEGLRVIVVFLSPAGSAASPGALVECEIFRNVRSMQQKVADLPKHVTREDAAAVAAIMREERRLSAHVQRMFLSSGAVGECWVSKRLYRCERRYLATWRETLLPEGAVFVDANPHSPPRWTIQLNGEAFDFGMGTTIDPVSGDDAARISVNFTRRVIWRVAQQRRAIDKIERFLRGRGCELVKSF